MVVVMSLMLKFLGFLGCITLAALLYSILPSGLKVVALLLSPIVVGLAFLASRLWRRSNREDFSYFRFDDPSSIETPNLEYDAKDEP